MATLPDPATVDFVGIAGWASGIALVAGGIFATLRGALKGAAKVAASLPPTEHKTDIYTTDSVAMHELAASIEAVNVTVKELHALLKAEIAERQQEENREQLKGELIEELRREAEAEHAPASDPRRRAPRKPD